MPEFIDAHGVAIVYDVHEATSPQRGVVQLAHGVGEHAGRYGAVIADLNAAGFTVYADDHRGHGRTGLKQHNGDASKLGDLGPGSITAVLDGLHQLTGIIKSERPGVPLILLGHSWGSMLSQKLIATHADDYDAFILTGSSRMHPLDLNAKPLNARWDGPDAHGLEWLSTDPAVWDEFRADPLTTEKAPLQVFGVQVVKMLGRPPKHLARNLPALLMVGSDDPVGGPKSVHKLADDYRNRSGLTDVTVYVYPGARHEVFNERDQEQVRSDLINWLEAHVPKLTETEEPA